MNKLLPLFIVILFSTVLLNACSSNTGRYQQQQDSTPSRLPQSHELVDAIPHFEAKSKGGNRDYTVLGKNYVVLKSAKNFKQTGIASYYGNKFHGHLTSNGEIYNMYSMSAAHKTLPLPSYVKVTNQNNNKSVIVRVNDRGPFHDNRIIDLSYSAAYKLGMLKTGTAPVTISVININKTPDIMLAHTTENTPKLSTSVIPKATNNVFIQVLATSDQAKAQNTANALTALYQQPVNYLTQNGIFKVQIGPLSNNNIIQELLENLKQSGYPKAFQRKKN